MIRPTRRRNMDVKIDDMINIPEVVADRFHPLRVECESHLALIFDISLKSFLADITNCCTKIASGPQIVFSRPVEL
jgi:hypothetical protein